MLQSIRDKTSGWIAYFIIGLISIPFALWGVNSYLGGGQQQPAAIVDGDEITPRQLDFAYARYRDRLRSVFGGTLPAAFDDEIALKEQVLTQIIEEQVLMNYVQDKGFRIGDQKLFENIRSIAAFQQDGKFDKDLYREQLASQGYAPSQFEQELRRTSEMGQLNEVIRATAFTLPTEFDQYQSLQNQSRKLRTLTVQNIGESIEVSDQEIEDYYTQQKSLYMKPAQVKVDYIEVSLETIKNEIDVSEDQLMERYQQMADHLTAPEVRKASHILLTLNDDASSEEEEQVKSKIEELQQRLGAGEDFAQLAREFSQDPGSADEGGDLGEVERGMMVKPFETALFDLQVGEVSEPVKTRFGWHLIKLHEVSGGDRKSFDEARDEILADIRNELAETRIYDLVETLSNIGYEQPDSLLPASEQLNLPIQTTDWFTRGRGEGVASAEKFRQAAFSSEVLSQNRNSETIDLGDNRVVIMHLNAHQPAERQPLDDVKDQVVEAIKRKKGREEAMKKGKELLAELKQEGIELDKVAEEAGLTVIDAGYVTRTDADIDRDVLNLAFTMAKPAPGERIIEGLSEADGDYTIVELSDLKVEPAEEDGPDQDSVRKSLTDAEANYEFEALVKSLAEEADIVRTPVAELQ